MRTKHKYKHICAKSQIPHTPQRTVQLWNERGDRLHKAVDVGWANNYWAKKKSLVIISVAMAVNPPTWLMIRVNYAEEEAFRKFRERAKIHGDYLVVRAKSPAGGIDSWFFPWLGVRDCLEV